MTDPAAITPVFVSAATAARLCEISLDTWNAWVRSGFMPAAHVDRGQIVRWHWPSIEKRLARESGQEEVDPFVQGALDAEAKRQARAARRRPKKGRDRVAA